MNAKEKFSRQLDEIHSVFHQLIGQHDSMIAAVNAGRPIDKFALGTIVGKITALELMLYPHTWNDTTEVINPDDENEVAHPTRFELLKCGLAGQMTWEEWDNERQRL